MPRAAAPFAKSNSRSGVLCADTIFVSCATPRSASTSAAFCIVGQSLLLPIMIETKGCSFISILLQFVADNGFEFVPGVNGASPIDDLSIASDHDIFRISGENEFLHRLVGIARDTVIEPFARQVMFDLSGRFVSQGKKNRIGFVCEFCV